MSSVFVKPEPFIKNIDDVSFACEDAGKVINYKSRDNVVFFPFKPGVSLMNVIPLKEKFLYCGGCMTNVRFTDKGLYALYHDDTTLASHETFQDKHKTITVWWKDGKPLKIKAGKSSNWNWSGKAYTKLRFKFKVVRS